MMMFLRENRVIHSPPLSPPLSTFDDDIASTVDSPTFSGSSSLGPSSLEWLPTQSIPEVRAPYEPSVSAESTPP
jgi:hypothetical protein